uniref:Uncharacterized protein n=1 Tax=Romanomermis culicivorax TaxID=13658 RepID=A0A915ILF5_ROMCU
MAGESEVTTSQASTLVSSLVNPRPMFKKFFNNQDCYIVYQRKQHGQDDQFFNADGDEKGVFSVIDPMLSKSLLHVIMRDEILALKRIIFYNYAVPNMCFCLYNHLNVEHSTKALWQKLHLLKLPTIKGNKQNMSSIADNERTE